MASLLKNNFIPEGMQDLSRQEFLKYYDNPKNFTILDNRSQVRALDSNSFPKTISILLTHGVFSLKSNARQAVVAKIEDIKTNVNTGLSMRQGCRLLKNFSDFGTRRVIRNMFTLSNDSWYKKQKIKDENIRNVLLCQNHHVLCEI